MLDQKYLDEMFMHHKPFGNQAARYEDLRDAGKWFAELVNRYCPESREQSLAITNIQQAVMWANASIAINEKETGS